MGGGYLTQSYPTQYREFWPSKTLTPQDSIENYREATAEEKQQWDAAHPGGFADVELPSDELVKMWKALCRIPPYGSVGDFNARTGYFELNGLRDITTPQARIIVADAMRRELNHSAGVCNGSMLLGRTNLPGDIWYNATSTQSVLYGAANMEVFILQPLPDSASGRNVGIGSNSFTDCAKLHTVGHHVYPASAGVKLFRVCPKLENVDFWMSNDTRRFSFSIADCPLLSYASVASMCRYGNSESKAITITLHADVYAKLAGDITNAAAAALTAEELTQWGALLTQAAERNITFATSGS